MAQKLRGSCTRQATLSPDVLASPSHEGRVFRMPRVFDREVCVVVVCFEIPVRTRDMTAGASPPWERDEFCHYSSVVLGQLSTGLVFGVSEVGTILASCMGLEIWRLSKIGTGVFGRRGRVSVGGAGQELPRWAHAMVSNGTYSPHAARSISSDGRRHVQRSADMAKCARDGRGQTWLTS